jgi:hypothetical protein
MKIGYFEKKSCGTNNCSNSSTFGVEVIHVLNYKENSKAQNRGVRVVKHGDASSHGIMILFFSIITILVDV